MPTTARLNHRHQPSTTSSTSSTSSSSSTRPALQRILTNSPSNAVHLSRSTARTSRRVRSHWFSHFALNWRRSSRSSKLFLASSMTLMAVQVIASIIVLTFSWEMYCDKPLRVFITVYILRLILASPLTVYLHLIPRRLQQQQILQQQQQQQQQQQSHSHLHSHQQHLPHNASSLSQQYHHHFHHSRQQHHHHRLVSAENRAEAGEMYPMSTLATSNNTIRVPTTTTNATTTANTTTTATTTSTTTTASSNTTTATTTAANIQALSSSLSTPSTSSSPPTPSPPTAPAASLMSPPSSDHQQYYHLHHHFNHQQQQQQASSLPPSVMAQAPPPNIMHRTSRPEVSNPLYADTTLTHWIDRAKSALDMFGLLWFIIGNYMLFTSSTCSETAVPLYYLSLVVIAYNYLIISVPIFLCTAVIFCLPCVLVGMRIIHVEDAVDMGGASSEEIATIPVYQFKSNKTTTTSTAASSAPLPNQIGSGGGGGGGAEEIEIHELPSSTRTTTKQTKKKMMAGESMEPALSFLDHLWVRLGFVSDNGQQDQQEPEFDTIEIPNEQDQVCAICLSTYDDGDILCQLWCNHHFHRTCVHEWLALNSRCPMCKRDCRGKPYPEERSPQ